MSVLLHVATNVRESVCRLNCREECRVADMFGAGAHFAVGDALFRGGHSLCPDATR